MEKLDMLRSRTLRTLLALCLAISLIPLPHAEAHAQDPGASDGVSAVCETGTDDPGDTDDVAISENGYVEGEMLVVFKDTTSENTAMRALGTMDVEEPDGDALADAVEDETPVVVKLDDGVSVEEGVQEALANPAVSYAQPNYVYTLPENETTVTVADSEADELETYLSNGSLSTAQIESLANGMTTYALPNDPALQVTKVSTQNANAWQLANIGAFDAWEYAQTRDAVTVCVLDTGCNLTHEDLKDRLWSEYAWNSYLDEPLTKDYNGHGTHCAGCVAATANNGLGTAGASYNAKVLPICVFDTDGEYCYTSTLIKAYKYLEQYIDQLNIHVVSMSLGGTGGKSSQDVLLEQEIASVKDKGVLTVAAGGNGDSSGKPVTSPNYPSDLNNVLAVTALSGDGVSPTSWCNYNKYKDICAPGYYIYSTYSSSDSSYAFMSGTSMATPIVAGCAALLWSAKPSLTPDEVETTIKSTAASLKVTSGREGLYGAGRIDIAAAVKSVASLFITPTNLNVDSGAQLQMECKNLTSGTVTWSVENGTGSATIDGVTGLLTGLMPGTVTVTATVPNVEDATASVTVTVDELSLDATPEVEATPTGLAVSWPANAHAQGYVVERSLSPDDGFKVLASVDAGTTTWLDETASCCTKYYYRVTPYSSVAREGTGVTSETVTGYRMTSVSTLASSDDAGLNAQAFESATTSLVAQGQVIRTAVLVSPDDPANAANAAAVAGVEEALVVEVGDTFDATVAAGLTALDVSELVVMASSTAVSDDVMKAYASATQATATRFAADTVQASAVASVTAYAREGEWGDTVAICNPDNLDAAFACSSYLYAASVPVLFTEAGGDALDADTLSACADFDSALILGDETTVGTLAVASLRQQGLTCERVSLEGLSRTMGARALTEGLQDCSYLSSIESGAGFQTLGLASYVGFLGSPVIEAATDEDDAQLELLQESKDDIVATFIGGSATYCNAMEPLVWAAIGRSPEGPAPTVGDVNDNGRVNTVDAQIVIDLANGAWGDKFERFPLPTSWTSATLMTAADVNDDGSITSADARAIQHHTLYGSFE